MLEIQLYIENQRVDLFKDESVTLTDSIQNIRDIDKVFTSFSKTFSLPASKTNSKIFKHYYNFHLDPGYSFDARVKVLANIELNSLPFRRGYIQLSGVELKDNIPNSYKVTFFGEIVKLKDAIGEQKLSDLQGLGSFIYNSASVYLAFNSLPLSNTCMPFITHTERLYYDSGSSIFNSGNLAPSGNLHGVKWNELKPAMRVNKIIQAIEQTYPQLQFSNDFFKNDSIDEMNELYLWVCRKSGAVETLSPPQLIETQIEFVTGDSTPRGYFQIYETNITYESSDPQYIYQWEYKLFPIASQMTQPYDITISMFGIVQYTITGVIGNQTVNQFDFNVQPFGSYILSVSTTVPITFSTITFNAAYSRPTSGGGFISDSISRSTGSVLTNLDFTFDYAKQMPDITVLDFLSGLFRMFNLTAFVNNLGVIVVQPLNDYFNDNPSTYDITEYTGIKKSTVNAALPYRQVKFGFKDTKSFLANKFGEIFNQAWGLLQYNNNQNDLTGSLYDIQAPFGHFLFERLNDEGITPPTQKTLQWGWSVDKSQNAMLPAPLLFYPVNVPEVDVVQFVDEVDANNEPISTTNAYPRNMPFNSVSYDPTINGFQLNFQKENSEWTGDTSFNRTLFLAYKEYIQSIFNPKQRLTNVEVHLPVALLLKIQMKDKIVIAGNNYRINKLTTNLDTGKSDLELINNLPTSNAF